MEMDKRTLYDFLCEYAREYPDELCIYGETQSYTVAQTLENTRGLARFLYASGIREGDFVALQAKRDPFTALVLYAVQTLGAIAVLCNPHDKTADYLKSTGVNIPVKACVEKSANGWEIHLGGNIKKILPDFSDEPFEICTDNRKASLVIFTSGSTSVSKAVMLAQSHMVYNGADSIRAGWYEGKERGMIITPINHLLGLLMVFYCIIVRYSLFFPTHTAVDHLMSCVEKYRITYIHGVPTTYQLAAEYIKDCKYDVSSLRCGLMSGGACGVEKFKRLEKELGITILPAYGMSESMGITTLSRYDSLEDRAYGTGKLFSLMSAKVADSNGNELPCGETGEICIKGPTVMLGYYNNPEANAAVFDADGWFLTGDLGYFDEKGILHINGRKKDIIIRGGENLSGGKIEAALNGLPFVSLAAVVGAKHELYGEVPCAMVVLSDKSVTEEGVRDALKDVLDKKEIPERIVLVDELPLLNSGKIDKLSVKKHFENG